MVALLVALFCVLANGFFVAAEFALAKVRPTSLEAAAKTDPAARRALAIHQKLDEYLPATQLGITLASLALGRIGEPALAALLLPLFELVHVPERAAEGIAGAIGFATISALHIVVGELVPKSLAIQRPEQIARLSGWLLRAFYYSVYPALVLLNVASKLVLRMLRLPAPDHAEGKLSLEELRLLIQASVPEDEATKRQMLERVLRATDRAVRSVMVPRVDMEILSLKDDVETWRRQVRKRGFSRYPLSTDDDPDHVVGYLYVKDLFFRERDPGALEPKSLRRDILIFPESKTVGEIIDAFQNASITIALVVDEYGGTAGLVTLDDCVAEIVGQVGNETNDSEAPRVETLDDGSILVDGSLPVDDLQLPGADLPEHDSADTVGGYIVATLGRLASPGDVLDISGYEAVVEDVRARRVHRVRFRKIEPRLPAEEDGA